MEFSRGEKVFFDFESGTVQPLDSANQGQEQHQHEPEPEPSHNAGPPPPMSMDFVGDILERAPEVPKPPSAPTFKARPTGFPAHKKRTGRVSAFKQARTGRTEASFTSQDHVTPKPKTDAGVPDVVRGPGPAEGREIARSEREQIDEENRKRLASMSEEEIERERHELLSSLSPALIQKLLGRGNIDEGSNEQDWDREPPPPPAPRVEEPQVSKEKENKDVEMKEPPAAQEKKSTNNKKVSFAEPDPKPAEQHPTDQHYPSDDEEAQILGLMANPNSDIKIPKKPDASPEVNLEDLPTSMHFPRAPQPPDLDPNSPSFLSDLHDKYFPDLPYDPASVSWMNPIDPNDRSSPYHPGQLALNASELRFNFKGALLAPSTAREIPVTEGLHHHSEAPEAAGYTIPELARLARSAVPAQRCIAYQTLGRFLYRLGTGEFGVEKDENNRRVDGPVQLAQDPNQEEEEEEVEIADTVEEAASAMATGLWNCVEECKVIETLTEEAARERGHLTARTYAQEALWNWRRGGGRKRKAV